MLSAPLSSLLVAASSVTASSFPQSSRRICGSTEPSETLKARALEMRAEEAGGVFSTSAVDTLTVPTWFHVVYANETEVGGFVPKDQINAQMQVLNDAWEPHGFSFDLLNVTYTQNTTWSETNFDGWLDMKKTLRQGGYGTLNMYTVLLTEGFGLLGMGEFPDDYDEDTDEYIMDGVVIQANSLPGGRGPPYVPSPEEYTEGDLANHEVGHWMGLLHTYIERGEQPLSCANGDNDFVDDTPVHLLYINNGTLDLECPPEGRDTCPEHPGLDPMDNFMSSQYQRCWKRFTPGQGARARNMYNAFRAGRQ